MLTAVLEVFMHCMGAPPYFPRRVRIVTPAALGYAFQSTAEILEQWRKSGRRPEGEDYPRRNPPFVLDYLVDGMDAVTNRCVGLAHHHPITSKVLTSDSFLVLAGREAGLKDTQMSVKDAKAWEHYLLHLLHLRSCIVLLQDSKVRGPDKARLANAIAVCRQVATYLLRRGDAHGQGMGDCTKGPEPEPIE